MVPFNFSRIKHRFHFGQIGIRYSSHPSSFCIHETAAVSAGLVAPLKRRPPRRHRRFRGATRPASTAAVPFMQKLKSLKGKRRKGICLQIISLVEPVTWFMESPVCPKHWSKPRQTKGNKVRKSKIFKSRHGGLLRRWLYQPDRKKAFICIIFLKIRAGKNFGQSK